MYFYQQTLGKILQVLKVPYSILCTSFKFLTLFLKLTWPYGVFLTLMWGQARQGPPYPSALTIAFGCIALLFFDRLIIPTIWDWHADRRERREPRVKVSRRERFTRWLFPLGRDLAAHRILLVDQALYRAWARNFRTILGHPVPMGYMILCRWPRKERLQAAAIRIIADRLRALGPARTVMYPPQLENVQRLLMTELHATRHACAFWRFIPGHHENFAVKLHGSH